MRLAASAEMTVLRASSSAEHFHDSMMMLLPEQIIAAVKIQFTWICLRRTDGRNGGGEAGV